VNQKKHKGKSGYENMYLALYEIWFFNHLSIISLMRQFKSQQLICL